MESFKQEKGRILENVYMELLSLFANFAPPVSSEGLSCA